MASKANLSEVNHALSLKADIHGISNIGLNEFEDIRILLEKLCKEMEDKGFPEAFIIATFKEEIISLQEAMELLK